MTIINSSSRTDSTVERVGRLVVFLVSQSDQEAVSDELDVLFHKLCVNSQQWTGKALGQESLFNCDGFCDDVLDDLLAGAFAEMTEEETGKIGVQTFVSGDEFVGKGQSGHETAFLEPEDGRERSGEEDSFDRGKCHEALCECRVLVSDPTKGPFSFGFNAGNCSSEIIRRGGRLVSMASKRYVRWAGSLI